MRRAVAVRKAVARFRWQVAFLTGCWGFGSSSVTVLWPSVAIFGVSCACFVCGIAVIRGYGTLSFGDFKGGEMDPGRPPPPPAYPFAKRREQGLVCATEARSCGHTARGQWNNAFADCFGREQWVGPSRRPQRAWRLPRVHCSRTVPPEPHRRQVLGTSRRLLCHVEYKRRMALRRSDPHP